MQKKFSKRLQQRLMAASVAAVSTLALIPSSVNAVSCIGEGTFDEGIGLPWHICSVMPAEQKFSISGGTYNVTIVNPGGKNRGGDSRWDLSFRHKNIRIEAGHKYKIHWEVEASSEGELCTFIGSLDRNSEGVWQNNSADWNQGWNNVSIKKGKNSFDSEFTANKTIENAQWCFDYGGAGEYQDIDCFPEGTDLKFDNMTLECVDCGDEYISEKETPCLWKAENHWNSPDVYGIINAWSDVRINQLGYNPKSSKIATYATAEAKTPVSFKVIDKSGEVVYEGTGKFVNGEPIHDAESSKGYYEESGEYCQLLDFSEVTKIGTYTIEVDDAENVYTDKFTGKTYKKYISPEFKIGEDIYDGVLTDVMNYFYQNRSGMDIEEKYISSYNTDDKNGKAMLAHKNAYTKDVAYIQHKWQKTYSNSFDGDKSESIDVSGGWYDADNYCKNVVGGANTVWLLQNMYERDKLNKSDEKWKDGKTMNLPENAGSSAGAPDVLDEARHELEFMFRMMVDPEKDSFWGEKYENFVYHEVTDSKKSDIGVVPYIYDDYYNGVVRIVRPPTYAATFNMIACAAQAARLWEDYDPEFAKECLDNAQKAWASVMKHRAEWDVAQMNFNDWVSAPVAPLSMMAIGDPRGDNCVLDEAYWAACELFATVGDEEYYDFLKEYDNKQSEGHKKAFDITTDLGDGDTSSSFGSFNSVNTAAKGTLSLYLSGKTSSADKELIEKNIKNAASKYTEYVNASDNAMGIPYKPAKFDEPISIPHDVISGYEYDSNGFVVNNSIIMAYAYDVTGDSKYLDGVSKAMDYIFGRNGLGISYVTGYGSHHINNPSHIYWANEVDADLPKAPSGVMASGAAVGLVDPYVGSLGMRRGEVAAQKCYADSVEAWFENTPSLEKQAALAWNISFIEAAGNSAVSDDIAGDANCDSGVDMADVVLVMQSLANPDKYGLGGSDKNAITSKGLTNADVDKNVKGLTSNDALVIQQYLLGKIETL